MHDSGAHIWISYSPDLRNWGGHKLVLPARKGAWWDANKVGLSPPLIETPRGWLMLYHGVRHTAAGCLYRLGLALLDLEHPEQCLARGDAWIFGPEAPYERNGDVGNVAFPCGYTIGADGDTLQPLLRRRRHEHRARDRQHRRAAALARRVVIIPGDRRPTY